VFFSALENSFSVCLFFITVHKGSMNKGTDFRKILSVYSFNKIRAHSKIVFETGYISLTLHISTLKKEKENSSKRIRRQRNIFYI
jgi:hypothetical protein